MHARLLLVPLESSTQLLWLYFCRIKARIFSLSLFHSFWNLNRSVERLALALCRRLHSFPNQRTHKQTQIPLDDCGNDRMNEHCRWLLISHLVWCSTPSSICYEHFAINLIFFIYIFLVRFVSFSAAITGCKRCDFFFFRSGPLTFAETCNCSISANVES